MIRALLAALGLAACAGGPVRADPPNPAFEAALEACWARAAEPLGLRACLGASARLCIEEGQGATMAHALCWSDEADAWAARAQEAQEALARRDPERGAALAAASQAFDQFAERECAYRSETFQGGSGAQPAMARCAAELWSERAIMLEATARAY